ncbi:AlpA family transcriptional regulator [Stenotrophomonas sp. VV52]|uniref:helix-turn-helix transcriptional regulator n=1 Tax=Stenotrophomonas sp. VV52 TaxID=2066958 RepID=UPI000C9E8A7C|nr:AlpA family transcriptional regulator [Stenotrophomonas sp. VV52]
MTTSTNIAQAPRRLLRLKQVLDRTGLPKSTIYSRISAGTFPKQVPVGCSVRWVESEIEAWIQALVDERDQHADAGGIDGGIVGEKPLPRLAA